MDLSASEAARAFAELFGSVFLRFHRRVGKRSPWTPQGWAVLQHFAMAGPLTVTEAARHMERAQSVMSEIIDGLERKGLLARIRDGRDRRRTLVWVTDAGRASLEEDRQVLSLERLAHALDGMGASDRRALIRCMRCLVGAKDSTDATDSKEAKDAKETKERKRP